MVMGLTTGLWVSAQVRLCDRAFIPATVVRRGDPDAGTVLLKLNRFEEGVTVYTQGSTMTDTPAWSRGTGPKPVTEAEHPGSDFLARLCVEWEAEARRAEALDVRVVFAQNRNRARPRRRVRPLQLAPRPAGHAYRERPRARRPGDSRRRARAQACRSRGPIP